MTIKHFLSGYAILSLAACAPDGGVDTGDVFGPAAPVAVVLETEAVASKDDAADDPAIWRNAAAPAESLVLGTDKKSGLYLYDMKGAVVQYLPAGSLNNVDLRDGFIVGGAPVALVAASDRTNDAIALFWLDGAAKTLTQAGSIPTDFQDPYGLCLYKDATGAVSVVGIDKDGDVAQFSLVADAAGDIAFEQTRRFSVGSQAEGCVADDRTGALYIGEETIGIWRYGAAAAAGAERRMVASIDGETLYADVEGLALAPAGATGGYLVASSQGDSAFVLYDLETYEMTARVRFMDADGVDGVTGTDGVEVALGDFGPGFEQGLVVAQDDENDGGRTQNFKYVSWGDVIAATAAE